MVSCYKFISLAKVIPGLICAELWPKTPFIYFKQHLDQEVIVYQNSKLIDYTVLLSSISDYWHVTLVVISLSGPGRIREPPDVSSISQQRRTNSGSLSIVSGCCVTCCAPDLGIGWLWPFAGWNRWGGCACLLPGCWICIMMDGVSL